MIEAEDDKIIDALTVLIHITEAGKRGMMQVVWPPLFRGIEQPDEFHPSQALEKLMKKFTAEHPQPFEELKEFGDRYRVNSKAMDFLEAPLYGQLDGLARAPSQAGRREHSKKRLDDFVLNPIPMNLSPEQKLYELEYYLEAKKECQPLEKELTQNYRSWLAKQCGSKIGCFVGGWGNLGDSITPQKAGLRRNEVIRFTPLAGYDPRIEFDMGTHNREAFLTIYEEYRVGWGEASVLVAYGRLIGIEDNMERINAIVDHLRLYENEYFKAKLDQRTFARVVNELEK